MRRSSAGEKSTGPTTEYAVGALESDDGEDVEDDDEVEAGRVEKNHNTIVAANKKTVDAKNLVPLQLPLPLLLLVVAAAPASRLGALALEGGEEEDEEE